MKLTIFFILSFVTASMCSAFSPDISFLQRVEDHRPIDDLRYFFRIYFEQYDLPQPDQLIGCFDDKSANLFFKVLHEFQKILIDTSERKSLKLHLEWIKVLILFRSLKNVNDCVVNTKDYYDLLDALDIEVRDANYLNIIRYVYYQARYDELLKDFNSVIDGLDNQDHRAAGVAYFNLTEHMMSTIKEEGIYFLGGQAFGNGFSVRLGLDEPSDSLECWDNETYRYYLDLLYKLAVNVTEGSWYESPINTHFFIRDTGREIFEKIPSSVWDCLSESEDNERLIDKIGLDIYDEEFLDILLRYINDNRLNYYLTLKSIKRSIERYNPSHAGYAYAHFIKQVAKWNRKSNKKVASA